MRWGLGHLHPGIAHLERTNQRADIERGIEMGHDLGLRASCYLAAESRNRRCHDDHRVSGRLQTVRRRGEHPRAAEVLDLVAAEHGQPTRLVERERTVFLLQLGQVHHREFAAGMDDAVLEQAEPCERPGDGDERLDLGLAHAFALDRAVEGASDPAIVALAEHEVRAWGERTREPKIVVRLRRLSHRHARPGNRLPRREHRVRRQRASLQGCEQRFDYLDLPGERKGREPDPQAQKILRMIERLEIAHGRSYLA